MPTWAATSTPAGADRSSQGFRPATARQSTAIGKSEQGGRWRQRWRAAHRGCCSVGSSHAMRVRATARSANPRQRPAYDPANVAAPDPRQRGPADRAGRHARGRGRAAALRHPAHDAGRCSGWKSEHQTPEEARCAVENGRRGGIARALRPGRRESVPGFAPAAHVHEALRAAPWIMRELGALIAGLHTRQLDLAHPPWECHVVHGLADQRAAIYPRACAPRRDRRRGLAAPHAAVPVRGPDQLATPMRQARLPRSPRPPRLRNSRTRDRAGARSARSARTRGRASEHGAELPDPFAAPCTSLNRMLTARRAVATPDPDPEAVHARARERGQQWSTIRRSRWWRRAPALPGRRAASRWPLAAAPVPISPRRGGR